MTEAKNWLKLGVLAISVLFLHTGTSYVEELLFKTLHYTFASFMILYMCAFYVLVYVVYVCVRGPQNTSCRLILRFDSTHRFDIIAVCLLYVGSNTVSKTALNYVSIPLQMVVKSCKLVAVMLTSGVILGKRYSVLDYIVATCFVSGMALFTYGDWMGSQVDSSSAEEQSGQTGTMLFTGIMWLLLALSCDSALGNLQEKVQKAATISGEVELMYIQSIVGGLALLILTAGLQL